MFFLTPLGSLKFTIEKFHCCCYVRTHLIVRYYNMRYISQSVISNDTWLRLNDESHSLGQVFWSLASDLRSWDKAEE